MQSYTKEAINAQMKKVFEGYQKLPSQPIKLDYDYSNYFGEVIDNTDNAIIFGSAPSSDHYLSFSWGTSGGTSQHFAASKNSFTETSW